MDNNRDKMNKDEFLQNVVARIQKKEESAKQMEEAGSAVNQEEAGSAVNQEEVGKVYDAIISEIKDTVCSGRKLSLTRFGTFSLKEHKGHPVQYDFSKTERPSENPDSESKVIADYVVFKFDVSAVFMNQIREQFNEKNKEKE